MPEIVLTTLNAKFIHTAFGLRYLMANLGLLRGSAGMVEFDINQRPLDIVEILLARRPKIIGFGVYIWNAAQTTQVIEILRKVHPEIIIILGGPEVSYETENQRITELANYVITGEADLKFGQVCRALLSGEKLPGKIIKAELPDFSQIVLPYSLFDSQDIAHRIIYLEASRGCPFSCEFCLSSLDIPVRQVPLPALLEQLQSLLDRGATQFKFVDRTFNLNLQTCRALLEFLLERHQPGHFYHFEMIPDRLPAGLKEILARFPPGSLQLEVGVQTFNPAVAALISRRQDYDRLEENFRFLTTKTGVHIHADLIVGLPGETLASFAEGFHRLIGLKPQEIQIGILKRLRGTPIIRHDAEWQMVYDCNPPYEILQNRLMDFATMHSLRRFARHWDLVGNSGNFVETTPRIWSAHSQAHSASGATPSKESSPFYAFFRWTQWLHAQIGRTNSIALVRLMKLLFEFLTVELGLDQKEIALSLWRDYQRGGRSDKPTFLRQFLNHATESPSLRGRLGSKRQARHAAVAPETSAFLSSQGLTGLADRTNNANIAP